MPVSPETKSADSPMLLAFRRLGTRLKRMAERLSGSPDDADDALQEAFCRLWPKADSISSENEAAALLTTAVRNISIDITRHQRRFISEARTEDVPELADTGVEDSEAREEMFRSVERIIVAHLSPLSSEILHRKEVKGESCEEIAAALSMQSAAVRMHLSRARKTIRECYKNKCHEDE